MPVRTTTDPITGQVIAVKTQIQRPHQRHEVFELGAKGVQEYDRRTLTGAKEADSVWHSTHRVKLSLLFTN